MVRTNWRLGCYRCLSSWRCCTAYQEAGALLSMYTISLRSMEWYVLSTIIDVLSFTVLLALPCNIRRFPSSLHSVWAACFLSSPLPWRGSLFKRYRTGNRCYCVFFALREIREIRTNLYSTGFRKHHMEESGRFHSLFENFYHIDNRSFAYLKGTGFLDNLLESHNTGLFHCNRVYKPLHRVE